MKLSPFLSAAAASGLLLFAFASTLLPHTALAQQTATAPDLVTLKNTFAAKVLPALQPMDDLREKLTSALQRTRQQAQTANETALLEATDAALASLYAMEPIAPSKRPEIENLRNIMAQQTTQRAKAITPGLSAELTQHLAALQDLKKRLTAGFAKPADVKLVDDALTEADQDARALSAGSIPWASGNQWREVRDQFIWKGNNPLERRPTGLFMSATPREDGPRLASQDTVHAPYEVEMRVIPDVNNLRYYFGNGKLIFNWELQAGQLRVHGFEDNKPTPVNNKGLKAGVEQTIGIKVLDNSLAITVDGKPFYETTQNNKGLDTRYALGPALGSKIELQSFRLKKEGQLHRISPGQADATLATTKSALAPASAPASMASTTGTTGTAAPTTASTSTSPGTSGSGAANVRPTADATWPRVVAVDGTPEVTVVEENAETKSYIYRSPNYEFVCDSKLGTNVVREFGRIFEATYLVNCKLPLGIEPTPEKLKTIFTARLFTEKSAYNAAGGITGSAGIYMSGKKSILVPLSSLGVKMVGSRVSLDYADQDQHTLIHEITHQMMNQWLGKLPTWLIEGSAEFVAWADYDRGRFNFGQMDRRIPAKIGRRGMSVDNARLVALSEIMNMNGARWSAAVSGGDASVNYATAALLTYYFYLLDGEKDGAHIIACFNAIKGGMPHAQAIETHLLRGRSHSELESLMTAAFKKEGVIMTFRSKGS